jgi:hypothetical protein
MSLRHIIDDIVEMPFGKHKGVPLDQVPPSYLRWCLANLEDLNPDLRALMEQRVGPVPFVPKQQAKRSNGDGPLKLQVGTEVRGVAKRVFAKLSMRYHPDRGGNPDQQAAVNEFYKTFLEELSQWETKKS